MHRWGCILACTVSCCSPASIRFCTCGRCCGNERGIVIMAAIEIFSSSITYKYKSRIYSCASIIVFIFIVLSLLTPLFIIYNAGGKNHSNFHLTTLKNRAIIIFDILKFQASGWEIGCMRKRRTCTSSMSICFLQKLILTKSPSCVLPLWYIKKMRSKIVVHKSRLYLYY